jgi:PAS domain S-box-containing protein
MATRPLIALLPEAQESALDPEERALEPAPRLDDDLRLFVESVHDHAIFMIDPRGHIASWNVGAARMTGYSADEVMGQHLSIFYLKEDVSTGKPGLMLSRAAVDGRAESEGWCVRRDGTRFWANTIVTALREPNGALRGYAKVTRDLTERERAKDARVSLSEAREAVRVRDEFLSIASHEIRTPLNSLYLYFEALRSAFQKSKSGVPAIFDKARRHLDRMTHLVQRLLDATCVGKGTMQIDARPGIDLAATVKDAVEGLRPEAERAGSPITMLVADHLEGTFDPLLVHQAVTNLITNAIKYGDNQPITVRTCTDLAGSAVIEVQDRGIGIPRSDIERIFDPFQRAADRQFGGLGLGLYLTRKIADAHGGNITVRSTPGAGSTFAMTLPLRRRAEA